MIYTISKSPVIAASAIAAAKVVQSAISFYKESLQASFVKVHKAEQSNMPLGHVAQQTGPSPLYLSLQNG